MRTGEWKGWSLEEWERGNFSPTLNTTDRHNGHLCMNNGEVELTVEGEWLFLPLEALKAWIEAVERHKAKETSNDKAP